MQDLLGPPSPASFPHLMTQQMRGQVVMMYEALCGDQLDVMGKVEAPYCFMVEGLVGRRID
jgi:hypothetical protein